MITDCKIHVGIDVSKATFNASFDPKGEGRFTHLCLPNNEEGFGALLKALPSAEGIVCHGVMEASGPYYLRLAHFLHAHGMAVSVVNPLVIRRFCQMRMVRAKTDKKDAQMIALYGSREEPAQWHPESEAASSLRQMHSTLELLHKQRGMLQSHKEAMSQSPEQSKVAKEVIDRSLEGLEKEISGLEEQIAREAKGSYGDTLKLIQTIPGIGMKTAVMVLTLTGGLKKFKSAKHLSSYFGLCPRIFDSGTSVKGKGKITKMGMGKVRAMLYVCTWSAVRCNEGCRELYERLIGKGKAKMVALIAVANKLLRQVFAVATSQTAYKP